MQLPESLQHFSRPTLFVATDHIIARFFVAGGDSLEELDGVAEPREHFSDHEDPLTPDVKDEPRLKHFVKQVALQMSKLVIEHDIAAIHLAVPAEVDSLLAADLPSDVSDKIGRRVHLELMKQDPLEIIERILKG